MTTVRCPFAYVPPFLSAHGPLLQGRGTSSGKTPLSTHVKRPALGLSNARMVARPENEPDVSVSSAVERLYDAYPFPPETLLDEKPLGYNWRWHYETAYAFCAGHAPTAKSPRILDAGCGTGESTSYLASLNPGAEVVAVDLSKQALGVAQERLQRSVPDAVDRCEFIHKSIFDIADLPGQFDLINCVGVIHHTPDPQKALAALAEKLRPGGILHIFVYAAHGRWEISLMQRALAILRGSAAKSGHDLDEGISIARKVFDALPDGNRLKTREEQRWAQENKKDATFADMYLHPQEVDYDIPTLFELVDASGLEFVGFSNPRNFALSRILGKSHELMQMARALPRREQYRLVELLDPESVTHFEFFLAKAPFEKEDWEDEERLRSANVSMSSCITGWPNKILMDRDYYPISLADTEYSFLNMVTQKPDTPAGVLADTVGLPLSSVRSLIDQSVLIVKS